MKPARRSGALVVVVVAGAAGLAYWGGSRTKGADRSTAATSQPPVESSTVPVAGPASYVGARACAECHEREHRAWTGSHHALAMQEATPETVQGDFDDARYAADGSTATFSRRQDGFFVRTDGPDGKTTEYRVRHTFGVAPLQQYLVELPGGRMQALRVAWDSRPKAEGGQRWFHLYPGEHIDHEDELHWTRLSQNWNYMCAECHSTDLRKGYDGATDTFSTSWSELNVACEACHGPGSQHVEWARAGASASVLARGLVTSFDERRGAVWTHTSGAPTATRSQPRPGTKEIDGCARCHARRGLLSEAHVAGRSLLDTHLPALLVAPSYHPDGQILEEDYEYASFLQSKMFHRGVTCSDCHDPHTLNLRAPGNALCAQCHEPAHFDSSAHHFHTPGAAGASCVDCHMPEATFMAIDRRRDHSLRVPRPDLSVRLGVPNACTGCHDERSAAWAEQQLTKWFGPKQRPEHFGTVFQAARERWPEAGPALVALARNHALPAIVRATAVAELSPFVRPELASALPAFLSDASPLVRRSASTLLGELPPEQRIALGAPLLDDAILAVRIEAARALADVPTSALPASRRNAKTKAESEYVAALLATAEHPQSHLNLGLYYLARGDLTRAEAAYRQALRLDPAFTPAYVNLADLARVQGNEAQVRQTLEDARQHCTDSASIEQALGLSYVRTRELPQAIVALEAAVRLAPRDAGPVVVLALTLEAAGDSARALRELERASRSHPASPDVFAALGEVLGRAGQLEEAAAAAARSAELGRLGSFDQAQP